MKLNALLVIFFVILIQSCKESSNEHALNKKHSTYKYSKFNIKDGILEIDSTASFEINIESHNNKEESWIINSNVIDSSLYLKKENNCLSFSFNGPNNSKCTYNFETDTFIYTQFEKENPLFFIPHFSQYIGVKQFNIMDKTYDVHLFSINPYGDHDQYEQLFYTDEFGFILYNNIKDSDQYIYKISNHKNQNILDYLYALIIKRTLDLFFVFPSPEPSLDSIEVIAETRYELSESEWFKAGFHILEKYNPEFNYFKQELEVNTEYKLIEVQREYIEETVYWTCILNEKEEIIDFLVTTYDNSEGNRSIKSDLSGNELIKSVWNLYEEPQEKKIRYTIAKDGFK